MGHFLLLEVKFSCPFIMHIIEFVLIIVTGRQLLFVKNCYWKLSKMKYVCLVLFQKLMFRYLNISYLDIKNSHWNTDYIMSWTRHCQKSDSVEAFIRTNLFHWLIKLIIEWKGTKQAEKKEKESFFFCFT